MMTGPRFLRHRRPPAPTGDDGFTLVELLAAMAEANGLAEAYRPRGYQISGELAYLNHLLTYVLAGRMPKLNNRVLRDCGALARLLPEVDALFGVAQRADYHPEIDTGIHTMMVIDQSARRRFPLPVRFAALTHDLGKAQTPPDILPRHLGHEERSFGLTETLSARLRVPNDCRDLALLMARYHGTIHRAAELKASTIVSLFEKADALRRPERFQQLLDACLCDYTGRLGWEDKAYDSPQRLCTALAAVNAVEAGKIAAACSDKLKIPERIHAARVSAVKQALNDA